ncbi:NRDE family protein [Sphingomonas daechungensis]|uniref:NRDE family protein n=1 Tax=Sphingomonas daechungensis TaxID=1176646 RepID=UPI0037843E45
MCTVVILRRPGHDWPLLIAANRDEMRDRPWRPPARHWPDRPEVIAGLDELAGGTWLGLNDHGTLATVLNRRGSLGPAVGKRSRGELVLEALDHADATDAAEALGELDPVAYRPFNMVIADDRDAFWLRSTGEGAVTANPIPAGISMLTAYDLNDMASPRIAFNLPRFAAARTPEPDAGDWRSWESLLASREAPSDGGEEAMMNIDRASGFGTSSSSLLALPDRRRVQNVKPVWLFAAGAPDSHSFEALKTH